MPRKKINRSDPQISDPSGQASPVASTEDRILAAATKEFAAHGFDGGRMQAIADTAHVNKAMLHYYFHSKANLYQQTIKQGFQRILSQVMHIWATPGSLEASMERLVDVYIDNYSQNPGLIKIVMREVIIEDGTHLKQAFKQLGRSDFLPDFKPLQLLAMSAQELDMTPMEKLHLIINLVGMCLISFTSPLVIESVFNIKLDDFDDFIQQRRASIKTMMLAFLKDRKERLQKA